MLGLLLVGAVIALIINPLAQNYLAFQKNLKAAKESGLPYVTTPVSTYNRAWLISQAFVIPLLEKLNLKCFSDDYIDFLRADWYFAQNYEKFRKYGDVFLIVAPGRNHLQVADADVVVQITSRRNDFPKPLELYGIVDVFGKNLVSTEGALWRHHRKITSPSFNEDNNRLVWSEALQQASSMVQSWLIGNDDKDSVSKSVWSVASDTMRLSLHVISRAGFGQEMLWPFEQEQRYGPGGQHQLPPEHDMSFTDAMGTFLRNGIIVLLLPDWLRARLPIQRVQIAHKAFKEWGRYLKEILAEKKTTITSGKGQGGLDLMGALIRGADTPPSADALREAKNVKGSMWGTPVSDPENMFSEPEILGNAFVFLFAGHETVANTLHFSMLLLAMNPYLLREVQESLDKVLGDLPMSKWDYDTHMTKLSSSMLGAVINEELRLLPPVVNILKSVPRAQPQTLNYGGGKVTATSGAMVGLNTVALQRHPKYWPRVDVNDPKDLSRFRPQRWFRTSPGSVEGDDKTEEERRADAKTFGTTLFNPVRGSYIPFSEGARSCIGKRFAQVEAVAALAAILKLYTVELDLAVVDSSLSEDAWTYEAAIRQKSSEERSKLWQKARANAVHHLDNSMASRVTLQMIKGKVPLRIVKRGKELLASEETSIADSKAW